MIDRIISLAVAISLALLVWLYARSRDQEVLDNVPIPVQITLPPGQTDQYTLEVNGPSNVPMSFTGSPARIRELRGMLQRGDLQVHVTLTAPEERSEDGHYLDRYLDTVHIDTTDVQVPPGITTMVVEGRNRIPVTLYRIVERRLPVRVDSALEERAGQITLEPASVLVRGPQEVLDKVRSVMTQPAGLPARVDRSVKGPVAIGPIPLVSELEGRSVRTTPGAVMVRWTPKPRIYEVKTRVQFMCPSNFALRPRFIGDSRAGEITLRVQGPDLVEEPKILAFIDLTQVNFLAGLNHEAVRLQLPRDFQLAQEPPRPIAFELVATDSTSRGLSGLPMQ